MPDCAKMVRFLRDKAAQFRRLATAHHTPLSARLREVARDLEAQADAMEQRAGAATRPARALQDEAE